MKCIALSILLFLSGCTSYSGVNYGHEAVDAFTEGFFYSRDQVRNVFEAAGRDLGQVGR